jgi:hypothetical protein
VHQSSAQVGNPRGARRRTTAVLQPGAMGMVVQRTKAAKQSHTVAVWLDLVLTMQAEARSGGGGGSGGEGRVAAKERAAGR